MMGDAPDGQGPSGATTGFAMGNLTGIRMPRSDVPYVDAKNVPKVLRDAAKGGRSRAAEGPEPPDYYLRRCLQVEPCADHLYWQAGRPKEPLRVRLMLTRRQWTVRLCCRRALPHIYMYIY